MKKADTLLQEIDGYHESSEISRLSLKKSNP